MSIFIKPLIILFQKHTCQVRKVQKREISLFASCQRGRFCAKQFCDIYFDTEPSNFQLNVLTWEHIPFFH